MPNQHMLRVAEPGIEDALQDKMQQIALKERERQTQDKAAATGLGYITLVGFPIGPETIALIPRAEAERLRTVCFLKTPTQIRLATVNPDQEEVRLLAEHLGSKHHANVEIYLVSDHSLDKALKMYDRLPKIMKVSNDIEVSSEDLDRFQREIKDLRDLEAKLQDVTVTDIFIFLLAGAMLTRSSDIHIEAEADDIRVRYRIDGVLTSVATLPPEKWPRIISRIKLMAGLKINIIKTPQDGRITLYLKEEKIDIRVSTLPTAFGESVVMRILRPSDTATTFAELGLRGRAFAQLQDEIRRPNGMIVVTGPTGSGKTTTLYAILKELNQEDTKIITLEDPIEYKLPGINQSQVDWSKGYTFAKGLRSILRQDPDIVMIGEIRDLETSETATQAALTGHLVLSTLHTNDAAGAIPRFLSMGSKPYLLAPALNVIIAQRLVRKICPSCRYEEDLDTATLERVTKVLETIPTTSGHKIEIDLSRPLTFSKGRGCAICHGLGYLGRIGIFEVLVVDGQVEQLILGNQISELTVRAAAEHQGMITMAQDGLLKALDGMTTVDEVFRVAQ